MEHVGETADETQTEADELLQMGQMLLGVGKINEALEKLKLAENYAPKDTNIWMTQGIAYAVNEKFSEARDCFDRVVKLDDSLPDVYFYLGNIDFLEDDFESGIKNFNQAVALGYDSSELFYNLGSVYEERNEPDDAIRNYSKAIRKSPLVIEYYLRKAVVQIRMEDYHAAIETLEEARLHCPDQLEVYHLMAAAYSLQDDPDRADEILMEAEQIFPEDIEIMMDRLRILIIRGQLDQALQLLKKIKDQRCTPSNLKELLLDEGKIYAVKEKNDQAILCWKRALDIKEYGELDSEIYFFLMNAYMEVKDYKAVIRMAKKMDRNDVDDEYSLTSVYFECVADKALNYQNFESAYENAIRYYRCISLKEPSRIDAYIFRAMCYKDIGEYKKALDTLDYVLLIQPDIPDIHEIRECILKEMEQEKDGGCTI